MFTKKIMEYDNNKKEENPIHHGLENNNTFNDFDIKTFFVYTRKADSDKV